MQKIGYLLRNPKRIMPHNILLFSTEATEVFAKLLVKVTKTNQTAGTLNLSDHSFICAFWILSALATKGEL